MRNCYSNRRQFLKTSVAFVGASLTASCTSNLFSATPDAASTSATDDVLAKFRAQFGSTPIQSKKLTDRITFLSGPGGNVVVLTGDDGKIIIDTFVQPAWPNLQKALSDISPQSVKLVIDTHWHFDHADNNGAFRADNITVLAHENTPKRMSEPHQIAEFNIHFPPSPPTALPNDTFADERSLSANGEKLLLKHVKPAHTDTDIYIHFQNANIVHCGDLVLNTGAFPLIDYDSGGKIAGMVEASDHFLNLVDDKTIIVPGHGGLSDKPKLQKFRDMLATVYERINNLKSQGKSLDETVAANPLADLNDQWGRGAFNSDIYTKMVYRSL